MLWFCEYYREDSGMPVNLSIGLSSREAAEHRGKVVCRANGYCGFWIHKKEPKAGLETTRVEYHGLTVSPRGVSTWRKVEA